MRSSKQLKKVIVLLLITSCILCDTINYKSTIVSAEAVSDTYEDAYITSGNTGKRNQKLVITRFTITKDSNKITNKRKVAVAIPYNKQGTPILNEAYQHEIEGCHIKGDVLQFLLTDSQNQLNKNQKEIQEKKKTDATYSAPNKVVQYIVEMKKSAFKEGAAKY